METVRVCPPRVCTHVFVGRMAKVSGEPGYPLCQSVAGSGAGKGVLGPRQNSLSPSLSFVWHNLEPCCSFCCVFFCEVGPMACRAPMVFVAVMGPQTAQHTGFVLQVNRAKCPPFPHNFSKAMQLRRSAVRCSMIV